MLTIRVATAEDISLIRDITFKTWRVTYSSILSSEQIDHMLEKMYSETSLQHQMNELSHHFILCYDDNTPCGFASYNSIDNHIYKLHKIYMLPSAQGKGTGKYMIEYICRDIKNKNGKKLSLNVNRNNPAIHFYTKLGFIITGEEDIDIGNGFFMNDYIMEKEI